MYEIIYWIHFGAKIMIKTSANDLITNYKEFFLTQYVYVFERP